MWRTVISILFAVCAWAQYTPPGGGGGGTVVTTAPPYVVIGGTSYVQWDMAAATKPTAPTFLNGVNCTSAGAGINGDYILSNASGSSTICWASYTATTSVEGDFSVIPNGTGGVVAGVWLFDSTNGVIWTLSLWPQSATAACILTSFKYTCTAPCTSTNPAFSANTNFSGVGNLAHLKISVAGGTATFSASLNGGQNFTTIATQAVGTITKGGFYNNSSGGIDMFSLVVN